MWCHRWGRSSPPTTAIASNLPIRELREAMVSEENSGQPAYFGHQTAPRREGPSDHSRAFFSRAKPFGQPWTRAGAVQHDMAPAGTGDTNESRDFKYEKV